MVVLLGRYRHPCKHPRLIKRHNQLTGSQSITRNGFIKLGGTGIIAALALVFPTPKKLSSLINQLNWQPSVYLDEPQISNTLGNLLPNQQGRVLDATVEVYDIPSFSGTHITQYWRDFVLPITGLTIGKSEDSFNRVWYKVGDEAYVHSGSLQPVLTITNPVRADIPPGGTLAEVTVPFTDAHWDPGQQKPVAYRYYYATTYWVMELVQDDEGNPWYGVRDDKWEYMYYVPASHLRFVPASEIQAISPEVPPGMKRIEVHVPEQVMIAFEYDQPVFMARIASGAVFSNGNYSTPVGSHTIFHKRASRHMARGNLAENGYDLPGVPWNSYITEDGIAFHGTYWHNNFGRPRSHGCINLTPQAAKWVYLWTKPDAPADQEDVYKKAGTRVDVIG
jgi:lipoprotein-anchoring transpeptidase ErfK/SrfK